jgi:hypothetical protein
MPRGMTSALPSDRIWTAALVVIGDEILSGRTQDKNIAQVASWLNVQGIRLKEVRVVADDPDAIGEAVNLLSAYATIICSPPAASARPMTISPSMRSRRRWAWRSSTSASAGRAGALL